jgi:RNase P subunit RPR2
MGEARSRGTQANRAQQAMNSQLAQQAPRLVCNRCQAALADVTAQDVAHLQGIQLAFSAHCATCAQDTWAVRGEAAAVKAFYDALEKLSGERVVMGTAKARDA